MTAEDCKRRAPLLRAIYRKYADRMVYIYAIQAGENGPVKIGKTISPRDRLKTLQQANHEELRGVAAWWTLPEMEKLLHEEFAHLRIRGEWFEPAPELLDLVLSEGRVFEDWA